MKTSKSNPSKSKKSKCHRSQGSAAFQHVCNIHYKHHTQLSDLLIPSTDASIPDSEYMCFPEVLSASEAVVQSREKWRWLRAVYDKKVSDNIDHWDIRKHDKKQLDAILSIHPNGTLTPHASNHQWLPALDTALSLLLEARKYQRKLYFLTIINAEWNTFDRDTSVDLKYMKSRVSHGLAECDLNGMCICEFQAITNVSVVDKGRLITPHVHAIVWHSKGEVDCQDVVKKMSGYFTPCFGAKSVVIEAIKEPDEDLANVLYYMTKPPASGKYRNKRQNGRIYFKDTIDGYRGNLCLRVAEILSHFTVRNLFFGRKEGAMICRKMFAAVKRHERATSQPCGDFVDPSGIWRRARKRNGKEAYGPVRVRK